MWKKEDEKHSEELILGLAKYLKEHDAANLKLAGHYLDVSLKDKFKGLFSSKTLKDSLIGLIPGVSTGKAISEAIDSMLLASYAGAMVRTTSIAAGDKASETSPYNYLANLFAAVLGKKASKAEADIFIEMFLFQAKAATMVGTIGLDGPASQGVKAGIKAGVKAIEKGAEKAVDLFTDKDVDDALWGSKSGGAMAWAIYLAAAPRKTISTVENCRLALRVALGMPYNFTAAMASGHSVNFRVHGETGKPVVSPADVNLLLKDMIKGDAKANFEKIKKFSEFEGGNNHIAYLELFLKGMKVWDKVVAAPLVLT